ncbi:hypothetical protein [Clostridium tyrobutyricum]|uniref:hypothetical protein n=1 Tax=Clostridium tyrobutyricum TaxID=1519 RepID=UPI001C381049|nr:hypothetical protein [Clostridium tyrobutyricum]MBV4424931.1 hypothetical protein [Clostridium tyrobutyricum]
MIYKFQYKTDDEKINILNQNKDKILIEIQNITEGNFLIFSDIKPLNNQLNDLQNNQLNIMNSVADIYSKIGDKEKFEQLQNTIAELIKETLK